MNPSGFLTRQQLSDWLESLTADATLIAPRWVEGALLYRPTQSSADLVWDFTRPVLPAKEFFFPPSERLLTIEKSGQQITLHETLPEGKQVVFGVRPCEARGIKLLDALFLDDEPIDPYYARHRENTALIGLACQEMGPTCFCTSLGGTPDDPCDVDIMLADVEGGYAVQVVTEKGKLLAESFQLSPMDIPQSEVRYTQTEIPMPPLASWPSHFDDVYWERMSERCLSCRLCAYICPTCRCFDLRDEVVQNQGNPESNPGSVQYERIRCWDSCAGAGYRCIAGGHNPRASKGQRLRNRFFCKFYYYPQQYGLGEISACTGCGRCIDYCPVNIDITEVLSQLCAQSSPF